MATSRRGTTNLWGFPGGKVDEGETPEQALVREIEEETGVKLDINHLERIFSEDCGPGKDGRIFHCYAYAYNKSITEEPRSVEPGILTKWVTFGDLVNGPFGEYNRNLFRKAGVNTLRDFLPKEYAHEHFESKSSKYLDVEVINVMDSYENGRWPGKEKNVHRWWKLANGKAVGWNENPGRGWSFPVAKW